MRVLIIEDETAAAKNLSALLTKADPSIEVLDILETISDAIEWFTSNPAPDMVFMDIHLSDGRAFNIFDNVEVNAPIIFTTAYDQYALEAFKVNSIDYILKPIKEEDLSRALEKFRKLSRTEVEDYVERTNSRFTNKVRSFLISVRDKLIPLAVEEVAYFYTAGEKVIAVNFEGKPFPVDRSLDHLGTMLDKDNFFRANRQFIISRDSINDISLWFGSRLCVNLKVEAPEKVIISKARVSDFKRWFMGT